MFAVGHIAIGYLIGRSSARLLHTPLNVPLLMVLSIIPDIDVVIDNIFNLGIHRGPSHSLIVMALVFIPIFIFYRKNALPYFLVLISHSLIGDFITVGQVAFMWPISDVTYGLHELGSWYIWMFDPINLVIEAALITSVILVMNKTGDWGMFFTPDKNNLLLIIPLAAMLPTATFGYPFSESLLISAPALGVAYLILIVLFSSAIIKTLIFLCKKRLKTASN